MSFLKNLGKALINPVWSGNYDKMIVGQTTESEAQRILGRPHLSTSRGSNTISVWYSEPSNPSASNLTIELTFRGQRLVNKASMRGAWVDSGYQQQPQVVVVQQQPSRHQQQPQVVVVQQPGRHQPQPQVVVQQPSRHQPQPQVVVQQPSRQQQPQQVVVVQQPSRQQQQPQVVVVEKPKRR